MKAQTVLAHCQTDPDDTRKLLDAVKAGMTTEVFEAADCAQRATLGSFLTQLKKTNGALARQLDQENRKTQLDFGKALRLETIQNAVMTYVDAESRYNLNAPGAQQFHTTKTVVDMFCRKTEDGSDPCSASDRAMLSQKVSSYRKDFNEAKIQVYTPQSAAAALNDKLKVLNQSVGPTLDSYGKWAKNNRTMRDTSSYEDFLKDHALKVKSVEERSKYEAFKDQYIQSTADGVGLLLYSKAVRSDPQMNSLGYMRINDPKTISKAVQEIKNETLQLAADTNNQMRDLKHINDSVGLKWREPSATALDSLKEMMKTNPIAAGRVLVDHPEFSSEVCYLSKKIASDDSFDRGWKKAGQVAGYGTMIVGGVLLATGFLSPVGALVEEGGVAIEGAVVLDAAADAASASRSLALLNQVNTGINTVALTTNVSYMAKNHIDLNRSIAQNQNALVSRTGGDRKKLELDEKQFAELKTDEMKTLALLLVPAAVGKTLTKFATSEIFADSKLSLAMTELRENVAGNAAATNGLKIFDYACAMLGLTKCQLITGSLHSLPQARQREVLSSQAHIEEFFRQQKEVAEANAKKISAQHELILQEKEIAELKIEGAKEFAALKPMTEIHMGRDEVMTGELKEFSRVSYNEKGQLLINGELPEPGFYAFSINKKGEMYATRDASGKLSHPGLSDMNDEVVAAGKLVVLAKGRAGGTNGSGTWRQNYGDFDIAMKAYFKSLGFKKPPFKWVEDESARKSNAQ